MILGQSQLFGAKELWKTKPPNKCCFFTWLALHDRNWTSDWLWHHGLWDDATCVFCDQESETMDHLLTGCAYLKETWFRVLRRCGWLTLTSTR
jgi:hypothetical protein